MKRIAIVGAAAVGDYIFKVNHLPKKGEIVTVTNEGGEKVPGGCAPNIACGIANLGQAVPVLYYPVGIDFQEWNVYSDWESRGIECKLKYIKDKKCGCAWMYMQKDGTTMCFSYGGAAETTEKNVDELNEDMVVISPMLNEYTIAFLERAIERKMRIVLTGIGSCKLLPYLERIEILIVNKCESRQLCREAGVENMIQFSLKYPRLKIYVTEGGAGSVFHEKGLEYKIPLVRAECAEDFTGAGDAYTSGVVSGIVAGYGQLQAGYIGACAASFAIEYMGGQTYRTDWKTLFKRLNEQHPNWQKL